MKCNLQHFYGRYENHPNTPTAKADRKDLAAVQQKIGYSVEFVSAEYSDQTDT
jgi:hypothetical protein